MTRAQQLLSEAYANINSVPPEPETRRKLYGSLCHELPVLIRQNGLCQTLAFFTAKQKANDDAYGLLLAHVAATLEVSLDRLLDRVVHDSTVGYMHDTRLLLQAWIYYKRFAESVLGVAASAEAES